MIIILSPAKKLDFSQAGPVGLTSMPEFGQEAVVIADQIKKMKAGELGSLMKISTKLAYESYDSYQEWKLSDRIPEARQAVLSYQGDAYRGLNAVLFGVDDLNWAQG